MPGPRDIARDCSPFLERLISRHPGWFEALEVGGRLQSDAPPEATQLDAAIVTAGLDAGLRQFRNREMMRIIWRELNGLSPLEETMGALSRLAELTLQAALGHHTQRLQDRFGVPRDDEGAPVALAVLGLGKLGGGELNLSSDIDIIFAFPATGHSDGSRSLANEQYFLRLARAVVKALSEVTEDGFCFRVDTRLRPFGEAGPLVCSFGAMEQYYQREGRDWERYALVKARPVAGDLPAGRTLVDLLTPFVYRRYIDYGAVEALQEMLGSIRADAASQGRENDIKRGPGGIREIEFLVQCLQLLRGGREPALRTTRLLEALNRLSELDLAPAGDIADLRDHYVFLRRLENAIQALHDQQTHLVPAGEDLSRVARVLGCSTPQALHAQLDATRSGVTAILDRNFPQPATRRPDDSWRRALSNGRGGTGKPMEDFLERLERTALSQRATTRLNSFMPMLLDRMQAVRMPESVQADVLELVYTICRRSAYLSLLVQNPRALDRMLELFGASDWIARTVIRHPALLDELIDPALGRMLPDPAELQRIIGRLLDGHPDTESAIQALNYLKRAQSLRIAVAELEGGLAPEQAQSGLTELAEALIAACLEIALQSMRERHGGLKGSGLAVIGYGTLGARDMSYDSDLDLVFLYEQPDRSSGGERPLPAEQYFTRMTRRMLGLATTPSPSGRLYDIDTRLRPNGRAGLLVSSLTAFERYQMQEAWVWELQALVRARPVAGDGLVAGGFETVRTEVLGQPRDVLALRRDVADMRRRMRAEISGGDPFKHGEGGLVDIDFVAQLGVLECAPAEPSLLRHTGARILLPALAECGWLTASQAGVLLETHAALTRARHMEGLSRAGAPEMPDTHACWTICREFLA